MNNIPKILEEKGWTRYKFWQAMGGRSSDRVLVYERLTSKSGIPPRTEWGTIKRVAEVLGVKIDELESNEK